jgi:hypothetical protein
MMQLKNYHWVGLAVAIALAAGGTASASTLVAFDNFEHVQTHTIGDFVGATGSLVYSITTSGELQGASRQFDVPLGSGLTAGNLISNGTHLTYSGNETQGFRLTYGPEFTFPPPPFPGGDLSIYDQFYIDMQSVGSGPFDLTMQFYDGGASASGEIDFLNVVGPGLFAVDREDVVGSVAWDNIVNIQFILIPPVGLQGSIDFRMNSWGGIIASASDPAVIPVPPAAGLILLGMIGIGLRRKFAKA